MSAADNKAELSRLYWACRRGMLELDLILSPFMRDCYSSLSAQEQTQFNDLLTAADTDLYRWFFGSDDAIEASYQHIVGVIRRYLSESKLLK